MNQKRIFITGGASGLGRALAERYAREGWRVCIADIHDARGQEALAALRGQGHYLHCDVRKEEDLQAVADWLQQNWGGVDIVVNNAGVAIGGAITDVPLSDWQWIIDINLLGVVRGCKVFTPLFRRQGGGRFVNISSMAGLVHAPMMAAYNATKAGVVAVSETLRVELERDRIAVSVVCPAFFRTHLTETLRASNPEVARITHKLVNKARHGADEIAELVYRGVQRGDFHILTHTEGKAAWILKRLAPFSLYARALSQSTRRMMGRTPPDQASSTSHE
ncbi:SDR family oxidoreductase [Hyalangium rubrum]|uniref:SDR family oxidoreductase n=1 Tax=Hyalangium rubrum TaxID=3103134 RepID=A0ABU5HEQ7_9BACT|nr:SDR family oxidoreductase [Hyalangium sp. s54d21]MDY7231750.1 SDR family oxidoreductase [Hyalangium sp. s54d21]